MHIAIFILAPLLLVFGLSVRLAGNSKILNVVDYSRVSDPASLHAWAGNRLVLLGLLTAALAGASILLPHLSAVFFIVSVVAIFVGAIWVAAGSIKFQAVR